MRSSIRDVFIGWGWGMDWQEKVKVQNCGRALVKPKNQPGGVVLAPWWLKWSTLYTVDIWTAKTSSNTGYNPDTCQYLKPPFKPFTSPWIHPCFNQPQGSRPKFRLETNSTVVWLYVGGVSLILPDVRFGTVSLDWVAFGNAFAVQCYEFSHTIAKAPFFHEAKILPYHGYLFSILYWL